MNIEKSRIDYNELLKRYQKSWQLLKDFLENEEKNRRRDLGESSFMCMKTIRKMNEFEQDIIFKEGDD